MTHDFPKQKGKDLPPPPKKIKEKAIRKREQTFNYLKALVRGFFTSHKELGFEESRYLCGGECYYCSEGPYFGWGFAFQDDYPMRYTIKVSGFKDDDYYLNLLKDLANSIIRRSDSLFKIDKTYKSDYDEYSLKLKMPFKDMITFGETNTKNENK